MTVTQGFEKAYEITEAEHNIVFTQKIIPIYREILNDVDNEMRHLYAVLSEFEPKDYWNQANRYGRLNHLRTQIIENVNSVFPRAARDLENISKAAISNVFYRHQYIMNYVASETLTTFFILPQEVVEISVYGTPKVWEQLNKQTLIKYSKRFGDLNRYMPQHGTLLQTLFDNKEEMLKDIQSTITRGLINGTSYRRNSVEIKRIMENKTYHALRIARTEGHRNMMAGNMAMTNAARSTGLDSRRMVVSTFDVGTRKQSVTVDSRKEDDDGFFHYPGGKKVAIPGNSGVAAWDINDRESVITVIDGVDPELRRARNPVTGETDIISYKSMPEWMNENNLTFNKAGVIIPKKG